MAEQFLHAVKSFKSQAHIIVVMAKVETAFNNASDKEDPAWLIQWIINNKLVCNLTLDFCFIADIFIRNTHSLFLV
jgi:hypothetical protein